MSAILFIIFNRPDTTQRVFDSIRAEKPAKLYVAADAPRPNRPEDVGLCAAARSIVAQIDWPCEVSTLFQERNLGCGKGVSTAISWFFEHEEEGIILEDDCLPCSYFFNYCSEMLAYYRNEQTVAMISGDNFQDGIIRGNGSYYFSYLPSIWGWATWKRTWNTFNLNVNELSEATITNFIRNHFTSPQSQMFFIGIWEKMKRNEIDSWGYPFMFSIWEKEHLCISPNKNLVSNIGFDNRATHTTDVKSNSSNIPTKALPRIVHPTTVSVNRDADVYYLRTYLLPRTTLFLRVKCYVYNHLPENFKKYYRCIKKTVSWN